MPSHFPMYLQFLIGGGILVILLLAIAFAVGALAAFRAIAGKFRPRVHQASNRDYLPQEPCDVLEEWLADNRSRLQIFTQNDLGVARRQTRVRDRAPGDSDRY